MILSVLICTIPKRKEFLYKLLDSLNISVLDKIEVLIDSSDDTVGEKRNNLLQRAIGEYVCFCDDDDVVCENWAETILKALESKPDCCSLIGEITFDGQNPKIFIHSIEYDSYFEKDSIYYRPPNHLNVIKSEIAKQFKFPEKNFGEDTDWAMQICRSGKLKKESKIDKIIYYYKYRTKK